MSYGSNMNMIKSLSKYMITNDDYISIIQKHNLQKRNTQHKFKRLTKENKIAKFHQNAQKNLHKKEKDDEDLYFLAFYYFFIDDADEFVRVHDNYSALQQAKYQIVEQLASKTEEAKRKFKLDDLQNKIGSMLPIDITELKYLSIAFNLNLILFSKYFYEVVTNDDSSEEYIVIDIENQTFYYSKTIPSNTTTEYMMSQRCKVKAIEEPIQKISAYKLQDLKDLCNVMKLDMNVLSKKTKKHLYELILQSF
jgi:hypothetical protein